MITIHELACAFTYAIVVLVVNSVLFYKWRKQTQAHENELRNIARDMATERHAFDRIFTRAEILLHNHFD